MPGQGAAGRKHTPFTTVSVQLSTSCCFLILFWNAKERNQVKLQAELAARKLRTEVESGVFTHTETLGCPFTTCCQTVCGKLPRVQQLHVQFVPLLYKTLLLAFISVNVAWTVS